MDGISDNLRRLMNISKLCVEGKRCVDGRTRFDSGTMRALTSASRESILRPLWTRRVVCERVRSTQAVRVSYTPSFFSFITSN